jgi:hypothetical protein
MPQTKSARIISDKAPFPKGTEGVITFDRKDPLKPKQWWFAPKLLEGTEYTQHTQAAILRKDFEFLP